MTKKENEAIVKYYISISQIGNVDSEYAMMEILRMFEPFRKSLAKKFAGKGVEFEDVCQVIDLKLIEGILDYDESLDSSAIRHITSKARNGIFNYYKKEMNYFKEDRKTISLDNFYVTSQKDGYKSPILDSYVYEYENYDTPFDEDKIIDNIIIQQGLEKLTDHQRELINMYYLSDMKQDEIAEELQIHQTNVSRATKRGVKKLRESFSPLGEHDDML
jgi:RNA polymerase sigma factor (sigma-70 family)